GNVERVALSPDGRLLVLATFEDIRIYETATGKLLGRRADSLSTRNIANVRGQQFIAFSPRSDRIVEAKGQEARLWNVASDTTIRLNHGERILCVAFNPKG